MALSDLSGMAATLGRTVGGKISEKLSENTKFAQLRTKLPSGLGLDVESSLYAYSVLRSLVYSIEGFTLPAVAAAVERKRPRFPTDDPKMFNAARTALDDLLRQDAHRIVEGIYPVEVLKPENPLKHLKRFGPLLMEGLRLAGRRKERKSHEFSEEAKDLLNDVPEYYRRNFHFQGDGYLSRESAELYEHQVEVLFAGAADAMRRLIIAPMKKKFGNVSGEGLTFLEIGSGTGRATRFVRLAFPRAKIVSLDLSAPYVKKAQESLRAFARHDFVEGDAAHMPFLNETFDAVFSVFVFHELPRTERKAVMEESLRVLKPGGFIGAVDSLQLGDNADFDGALEQFPRDFHEPFYTDYIKNPTEALFAELGLEGIETALGFFSKAVSARKASPSVN